MNKILLTLALALSIGIIQAQDTIHLRNRVKETATVTDRPPQAVYFQLGGSGPILSVNYDRRFSKRLNGPGFAVGAGFWGVSGLSVFSLPISLNYLVGTRSNFFEFAGGATLITSSIDLFDDTETGTGVLYHLNAGYRYQPTHGGFFFRGGISPLFAGGGYVTSYYIGFGHNF